MKLSYIIPVWNREDTVLACVDSVLDDSLGMPVEIIVVDDASSDATLDRLARRHNQITVITSHEKTNANVCRQRGVEYASGDLICFLDSDDRILPGRSRSILDFFQRRPDVTVLVDSFSTFHRGKSQSFCFQSPQDLGVDEIRQGLLHHAFPITFSSIAARREGIQRYQLLSPDCQRHQDRDFVLATIRSGGEVALRNEGNVLKVQHRTSFSRSARGYLAALEYLLDKYSEWFDEVEREFLVYLYLRNVIPAVREARFGELFATVSVVGRRFPDVKAYQFAAVYRAGRALRAKWRSQLIGGAARQTLAREKSE